MDTEARFQALEKKLRLHKRLGLIAMALLVGSAAFAATRPVAKEIAAERFVLKDSEGNVRSMWGMSSEGPQFSIVDKSLKPYLMFGMTKLGPIFLMTDQKKYRLNLFSTNRYTGLTISDLKDKPLLFAGVKASKGFMSRIPNISLYDKNGKTQVLINAKDRNGTPSIAVLDASNRIRASMGFTEGSSPAVILEDKNGVVRSINGLTEDDSPKMGLLDKDGRVLWMAPPEK